MIKTAQYFPGYPVKRTNESFIERYFVQLFVHPTVSFVSFVRLIPLRLDLRVAVVMNIFRTGFHFPRT